jgi:hypothetical protein
MILNLCITILLVTVVGILKLFMMLLVYLAQIAKLSQNSHKTQNFHLHSSRTLTFFYTHSFTHSLTHSHHKPKHSLCYFPFLSTPVTIPISLSSNQFIQQQKYVKIYCHFCSKVSNMRKKCL